ncbi:MAG: ACT domain-containing protein, partial [Campylobacterota bacterium]|nr:ACT domain-containing protein [Campylobacterota bacterium]
TNPMLGYKKPLQGELTLLPKDEISTNYYLRLEVNDESGVLAATTETLSKFNISIESMLQQPHPADERAKLLFTTHECKESKMQEAIVALSKLNVVHGDIAMMRIEK